MVPQPVQLHELVQPITPWRVDADTTAWWARWTLDIKPAGSAFLAKVTHVQVGS